MQEESFKIWLVTVRGLNERTAGGRLSNCKRVEASEGDLDKQWGADGLAALIGRLTYSKEDERSGRRPKHRIEIVGDVYNGTATLKNAVVLYREFRSSEGETNGSRKALAKRRPQVQRTRRAARADQLDHLAPELRRIRWMCLCHCGHLLCTV